MICFDSLHLTRGAALSVTFGASSPTGGSRGDEGDGLPCLFAPGNDRSGQLFSLAQMPEKTRRSPVRVKRVEGSVWLSWVWPWSAPEA